MSALILDCDGVLADTERDGHLPAFNRTFEEFGLPVRWSEEEYGEKLKIAFRKVPWIDVGGTAAETSDRAAMPPKTSDTRSTVSRLAILLLLLARLVCGRG